jgi:4-amino-4-deoxy-L-arabinose transferase-like glycosyltransferase
MQGFQKTLIKISQISDKKIAFYLFFIALILRSIYAFYIYISQPLPETNAYFEIAEIILDQKSLFYITDSAYYESAGPVIPWLNAFTMLIFGKNYLGLYLVTALGSALITLYTYKTARLFLDKNVSLFAGIWSVFYLFYFYYTPSPGKDIWMAFFLIFLIYYIFLLFVKNEFSYPKYILFITMFAISFHLDERFFVFTPFIGIYILLKETSGFRKLTISKTALFGLLLLLLMIPWTIRNYEKHQKIVILSTRTETFTDPLFGYESRKHIMDDYNNIHGIYYIHENQFDSVINGHKTHTDMGRLISQEMVNAMRKGEMPKPLTGIRACWSRTITMLEPFQLKGRYERSGYFYYKKSLKHNIATFLFYGVMFLFSIPGFYLIFNRDRRIFIILITVVVVYILVHSLTIPYTNWRYRLPLDAIFIMAGWVGILGTIKMFKNKYMHRK